MLRILRAQLLFAVFLFACAGNSPADALTRRGTETAGRIAGVEMVAMSTDFVVTAVRDADGFLRLISWNVASDGTLSRRDTVAGEEASLVSISRVSASRFVTAIRDRDGELRLSAWDLSSDGTIRRLGNIFGNGPRIRRVSISNNGGVFGTAVYVCVRDESDRLHVTEWLLSRAGLITFVQDQRLGSVAEMSMSWRETGAFLLTALLGPDGQLELGEWSGRPIELRSDRPPVIPGGFSELASASAKTADLDAEIRSIWLAAVRDDDGNLRLIAWGRELRQLGAVSAGPASQIAVATSELRVFTAMRDDDGNLRVISWDLYGGTFLRHNTATAGPIGATDKVAIAAISPFRLVTAMRDLDGNLRLIVWADD